MTATAFKRVNADLDTIFEPYTSGDKADVTGLTVDDVDLSDLFAPYVSGDKAVVTHYQVDGVDLKDIFAPLGGGGGGSGVTDPLDFDGAHYNAFDLGPGGGTAEIIMDINADGTYEVRRHTGTVVGSGNWYSPTTGGIGSGYELLIAVAETPGGGDTLVDNPATSYVSLGTNRTLTLQAGYAGVDGETIVDFEVDVTIKLAGGAVVGTATFTAHLVAGSTGP